MSAIRRSAPKPGNSNRSKPASNSAPFINHGVAMPVSNASCVALTVDGAGRNVILIWLSDHRGTYALAMVDAQTGASREFPTPFPLVKGKSSNANSVLSRKGKYYTHFGYFLLEFDPVQQAFTFVGKTSERNAICILEDDAGVIYSVGHPNSGVVSFDPATRRLHEAGIINQQKALHYHGYAAADDAGWIYFAVGEVLSQIIAFDPRTDKAIPLLGEAERAPAICSYVHRGVDGKVYGLASAKAWPGTGWYELYRGKARHIGVPMNVPEAESHARRFPDGTALKTLDMWNRTFTLNNPAWSGEKTVRFEYSSEGSHAMSVSVAPDRSIWGGAAFPMSFFNFQPGDSSWTRHKALGQWNSILNTGDRGYIGGYIRGYLQEWDPAKPWADTVAGKTGCNPQVLVECFPDIDRPHCLLFHRETNTVAMGGIPGYGYTGGGLLLLDRTTGKHTLLKHEDLLPWHSTMSLAELPEGRLLGGTTTRAGTGGQQKAAEAELYILDMASRKVLWHEAVFPGAQEYSQLCAGPRGLVYGLVSFLAFSPERMEEPKRFFVFDPVTRKVVHQEDAAESFGLFCYQQGQRKIARNAEGRTFLLFQRCVVEIDPVSFSLAKVADVPEDIFSGGDILDDRLYYSSGSHLCSCRLPPATRPNLA